MAIIMTMCRQGSGMIISVNKTAMVSNNYRVRMVRILITGVHREIRTAINSQEHLVA